MIGWLIIVWALAVTVSGGTAYYLFPWFNLTAIIILAVMSAIFGGIAVFIVRLRAGGAGGGGSGGARATKRSKGAQGRDR